MTLRPEFDTAAILGLRFQPWIGDEYGSGSAARVRTLILGESHYGPVSDIPDLRDLTIGVVNAYLGASTSLHLFKRVEELFEVPDDTARRHAFWNSIAFANYIQVLLADQHHRPTAADWSAARAPFSELLHVLEPDIVLVLGTGV